MNRRLTVWGIRCAAAVGSLWLALVGEVRGDTPVWISNPATQATVGRLYEYFTLATDAAGGAVTYAPVSVPAWLSLEEVTSARIYTIAGTLNRGNHQPATEIQLWTPTGGAYDAAGNLYVVDRNNHRLWRRTPDGLMSIVAGTGAPGFGGDGGAATRALLYDPVAVAVGLGGELYLADRGNHRVRRISTGGLILTVAGTGTAGFTGDGGAALSARLNGPAGVLVDGSGVILVSDAGNQRIRAINRAGQISTVAGTGQAGPYNGDDLPALEARISGPGALALEPDGGVLFADVGNNRVRRLTTDGRVQLVAGNGLFGFAGDGMPATQARLSAPQGMTVDAEGIVIADTLANRIRRVGLDGVIRHMAGTGEPSYGGDGGPAASAHLGYPAGVLAAPGGGYTILDTSNDRVRFVDGAGVINTIAGTGLFGSKGDGGLATAAILFRPQGGVTGPGGVYYISDTAGHVIRRVNPDQTIERFAGNGTAGYGGDGGPATEASLDSPAGLAVDSAGNVFIADSRNHRIRVVTTDGLITTFAGTGELGNEGDGGPAFAATMSRPRGLVLDGSGNLYLVDQGNSRVRRVETDGMIRPVAGSGLPGYSGDGGLALEARFTAPEDVALDAAGNLYISDTGNHRVRRVDSAGIISTFAGTGVAGFSGDGGEATSARLNAPTSVAAGPDGSVYIADSVNHRVRRVTDDGVIRTFAGSGTTGTGGGGYAGDGGSPTSALLMGPHSVEVNPAGEVVITEQVLGVVRKVFPGGGTLLRGTPNAAAAGLHEVTLQAKAGEQTRDQTFTIQVESLPSVTKQPASQQVLVGADVVFTVTASGTAPLEYQWLHKGAVMSDGGRVSGSATAQLTLTDVQAGDAGGYQVVVMNAAGSRNSQTAQLTVLVTTPPEITGQPQPLSVAPGDPVTFTVEVTGSEPLTYRWLRNGTELTDDGRVTGSQTAQLSIASAILADAGAYTVTVENAGGSVTSNPASLTVTELLPPTLSQPVLAGNVVRFQVSGSAGRLCEIQYSTDLRTWTRLTEVTLATGPVEVTDGLTPDRRFYRALAQ